METIKAVRGFKDILPGETERWQFVEDTARKVFSDFGFKEIKVPILEKTDLFRRSIGETTDIVEKEMYTFEDRGGESLTLRPEATASVMRAYLEHNLHASDTVCKLFTFGPMFRRERPQKGRYRQFHQINVELLGSGDPLVDAEVIYMLMLFLGRLRLTDLGLEINSLGCPECRPAFRKVLGEYLADRKETLCGDCRRRLDTNPLRVFDCKVKDCRAAVAAAPFIIDYVCSKCGEHFREVQEGLKALETAFTVNPRMVRGLDYYTKTTFEVTTKSLGAQNAVAGGGRYDRLVEDLGGPAVPGIGFAAGVERLISLLPAVMEGIVRSPDLYIAALGPEARKLAFLICNGLRKEGFLAETDYSNRSLKSQMKRSDKLGARYTLLLGENEIRDGKAFLRNMKGGSQNPVSLDDMERQLVSLLKER
ncbi:MAG TPA: histidine--tRNA ligase [Syntrophales bacterium]|nr:histidine--tRNA ligase [Syntrophales bacterium]HPN23680.1 histidine--tRNA ligase [Syntrophales bacterium]